MIGPNGAGTMTGFLVPPGDSAALATALLTLADLPETSRRSLGRASRALVERCLSSERSVATFLRHCEAVVALPIGSRIPAERRLAVLIRDIETIAASLDEQTCRQQQEIATLKRSLDGVFNSWTWKIGCRVNRVVKCARGLVFLRNPAKDAYGD